MLDKKSFKQLIDAFKTIHGNGFGWAVFKNVTRLKSSL
jgi:hypothetical protein